MEPEIQPQPEEAHLSSPSHWLTHLFFVVGIVLKGVFGLLDILAGLLFFSSSAITDLVAILTRHELGEDHTNFLANKIVEILPYISLPTQLFVAWYFLIHGILNIVLVVSLLRRKLWAYPAYMAVLFLFVCYQLYRFTHTHSTTLLIVTFLDAVMIWLIWREYQFVRRRHEGS